MLATIMLVATHILMDQDPIRAQQYIAMPIMLQLIIVISKLTLGMGIITTQRNPMQLLTLETQESPIQEIHLGITLPIITTLAIIHILPPQLPTPQARLAPLHTPALRTQQATTLATTIGLPSQLPTPQARLAPLHTPALRTQLVTTLEPTPSQLATTLAPTPSQLATTLAPIPLQLATTLDLIHTLLVTPPTPPVVRARPRTLVLRTQLGITLERIRIQLPP